MTCPIRLDKIHCQNCYFWRNGKCDYDAIMREHRGRDYGIATSTSSQRIDKAGDADIFLILLHEEKGGFIKRESLYHFCLP